MRFVDVSVEFLRLMVEFDVLVHFVRRLMVADVAVVVLEIVQFGVRVEVVV